MNYEETIAYIHSAYWKGTKDGLQRTRELLSLLGNTQNELKFVHVAGTNGKGSTCAMLASILQAAGYRTGLYTSPFVNRFNERIALNGTPISDQDLVDVFSRIRPIVDAMPHQPSEFELITCAAMLYYREQRCDVVVLEVGMGGEFDSTNVIETPLLTIITAMGFDHMQYLGNTMTEIASAKAGIIKPGGTTLIYGENPEADKVFRDTCARVGSRLVVTDHGRIVDHAHTLRGHDLSFGPYEHIHLPLIGSHQVRNAAVVLTAVEELKKVGLSIPDEAVCAGMAAVRWPARMELLSEKPVFLLDGGHNPHGFRAAAATLKELFPDQQATVMMGVMADKDHGDMIRELLPIAKRFITVRPESPRAMTDEDLAAEIRSLGGRAEPAGTVQSGIRKMLNEAAPDDVLLAIGSLYMAGDVRTTMGKGA
jgi:dihydrofolate synthase/folylpolyglutamate synthase